jgi:hypothetical protein
LAVLQPADILSLAYSAVALMFRPVGIFGGCSMMRRAEIGLVVVVLSVGLVALSASAGADDKDKADPTGTWKWSFTTQDGQTRETTLKLKLKDKKLTGHIVGRDNAEVEIRDAKIKDGEISFHVIRDFGGQEVTIKYKGKLEKDTIKGKTEFERDGQKRERDWEAKRQKDEKDK